MQVFREQRVVALFVAKNMFPPDSAGVAGGGAKDGEGRMN